MTPLKNLDDHLKQHDVHARRTDMDKVTKVGTLIGTLRGEAAFVAWTLEDEDTWERFVVRLKNVCDPPELVKCWLSRLDNECGSATKLLMLMPEHSKIWDIGSFRNTTPRMSKR